MVEFALLLPLLIALLVGIVAYGEYFLIAHGAQQLANDAARATLAGQNAAERSSIARASVTSGARTLSLVTADKVTTSVSESGDLVTVHVRVDARAVPLIGTPLVPMPDAIIDRRTMIHAGATL